MKIALLISMAIPFVIVSQSVSAMHYVDKKFRPTQKAHAAYWYDEVYQDKQSGQLRVDFYYINTQQLAMSHGVLKPYIKDPHTSPLVGRFERFYPDGRPYMRQVNDAKGRWNGIAEAWFYGDEPFKQHEVQDYDHGFADGILRLYDQYDDKYADLPTCKQPLKKNEYEAGCVDKKNLRGPLHEVITYQHGKKTGPAFYFNYQGIVTTAYHMVNGYTQGTYTWNYADGKKYKVIHYHVSQKNGLEETWNKQGVLVSRGSYALDKYNGKWEDWWDNANRKRIRHYDHDHRVGEWQEFYKNGQLKQVTHYQRGHETGEFKQYRKDGSPIVKGTKKNGKKVGQWQTFYPSGQMETDIVYGQYQAPVSEKYWDKTGKLVRSSELKKTVKGLVHRKTFVDDHDLQVEILEEVHNQWGSEKRYQLKGDRPQLVFEQSWKGPRKSIGFNDKLTGRYYSRLDLDGAPKAKGYVETHYTNGFDNGDYIRVNNDGIIVKKGTYRHGKRVGKWLTRSQDFRSGDRYIEVRSTYDARGRLQGKSITYNQKTGTTEIMPYVNGKQQGKYQFLNQQGKVVETGAYVNNRMDGYWHHTQLNYLCHVTSDACEGRYRQGKPQGTWRYYGKEGYLTAIEFYDQQGRLNGKQYHFAPNGQIHFYNVFHHGEKIRLVYVGPNGHPLQDQ